MQHYSSITDLLYAHGYKVCDWGDQFVRELPDKNQYIPFGHLTGHTVESFYQWLEPQGFFAVPQPRTSESQEGPSYYIGLHCNHFTTKSRTLLDKNGKETVVNEADFPGYEGWTLKELGHVILDTQTIFCSIFGSWTVSGYFILDKEGKLIELYNYRPAKIGCGSRLHLDLKLGEE